MLKEFLSKKISADQIVIRDVTVDENARKRLVGGLGSRFTPTTAIHHDKDDYDSATPIEIIIGPKFDAFAKYFISKDENKTN